MHYRDRSHPVPAEKTYGPFNIRQLIESISHWSGALTSIGCRYQRDISRINVASSLRKPEERRDVIEYIYYTRFFTTCNTSEVIRIYAVD